MGVITAGFQGERGDRGDIILHDIDTDDWVIAYANHYGFVGAGKAGGPETYRLVRASDLPSDWESDHVHIRDVAWHYYLETMNQAVSPRQVGRRAPRQTKEEIRDVETAKRLIDMIAAQSSAQQAFFPEEIATGTIYSEGAILRIVVDRYERSPEARLACVAHWGTKCSVCAFDFFAKYGQIGRGFIHVHHLSPLAQFGEEHPVDPVADLMPVCPNCHAMLHRTKPPMSIESLKQLLKNNGPT